MLEISTEQLTERWSHYTSPIVPIKAGTHQIAITIGTGGMDMIDNVAIARAIQ